MRSLAALVVLWIGLAVSGADAYFIRATWRAAEVPYYLNPVNNDVTSTAAESAVLAAAAGWTEQTSANFAFKYAGRTTVNTVAGDGKNVVFFRNASNGSLYAETFSWRSSDPDGLNREQYEADIVFYDGAWTLATGTTGCVDGFYINDVGTHEFGHALGLGHSEVGEATMYATASRCSQNGRSLHADDISAVELMYPPLNSVPRPAAPTSVRIR